jgi:hypothetical protein
MIITIFPRADRALQLHMSFQIRVRRVGGYASPYGGNVDFDR